MRKRLPDRDKGDCPPVPHTQGRTEILKYSDIYFTICPMFYVPLGLIFVFRNTLQGMGHSLSTLLGAFIELASRIVLAIFAVRNASYAGVCYANAIAWLSAGVLLFVCYEIIFKKETRMQHL